MIAINSITLLAFAGVVFLLAYRFYARKISRMLEIDDNFPTPAHTMEDGVDYVPARMPVLLGHHFSSIAGAAPIIGPITAAAYGWGPVFLWIVIGAVFLGAVHDLTSLVASIRHSGRSIGEVIEGQLGKTGKVLFLLFCWSTLILVVAVFMVVVARTFTANPATVTASLLYLVLAIFFGLLINKTSIPVAWLTVIFIPLLALSVWVGITYPLDIPQVGVLIPYTTIIIPPQTFWICILLVYIFIASVTPVWILLQPRDYLSSFLLYALIIGGFVGACVAQPEIKLPAYRGFTVEKIGTLFPMLFVVVACGAISGFHSLVASGTSAKQLDRESDAVPVGYGAMLIEGALAVLALITALRLSYTDYSALSGNPILLFSQGIGDFLSKLQLPMTKFRLPMSMGVTFATLAVSAFALTTLDTATRLSRFSLQELLPRKGKSKPDIKRSWLDRYSATLICVTAAGGLALSGEWRSLWPLFGSANQLLAALALLTVSVWLYHLKRNIWYTLIPTCFMFAVTLSALAYLFHSNFGKLEEIRAQIRGETGQQLDILTRQMTTKGILLGVTGVLFLVAMFLLFLSIVTFKRMRAQRREESEKRELPFLPRE